MVSKRGGLLAQGVWLVLISVLAAAISFIKEMIIAQHFGTSSVSDAYTMAIQVPEILFEQLSPLASEFGATTNELKSFLEETNRKIINEYVEL